MQKLYEDRRKEQTRQRRIRLGLVALAAVLATTGSIGRYVLAKVGVRNVRLVEKTLDPLEQISLYGLELGGSGSKASSLRMDSLENAYSSTYIDSEDIELFRRLRQARRSFQARPTDGVRAMVATEAFRKVVRKNGNEARSLSVANGDSADLAGWGILFVSLVGSFTCLSYVLASARGEKVRGEREELAMSLIESAPDAIVIVDQDAGRIIVANPAAERLFGLPFEALGRTDSLLFSPATQPDGRASTKLRESAVQKVLDGESILVPWTVQNADGRAIPCEARLSRLPVAGRTLIRASFLDVTEREAAQQALAKSEARFRTLVEDSSIAIRISMDGYPIYVNKACLSLFGYEDPDELLAIPVRETYHPDERPMLDHRIQVRAAGGSASGEYDTVCLRRDGSHFHAHIWTSFEMRDDGEMVVGFLVDTTEAVHATEREQLQREQLIHADRMASLGVLLAGMAHEINNPNNLALFNADLLGRILSDIEPILDDHHERNPGLRVSGIPYEEMKPEIRALVEGIRGGALRIRDIIAGLKDFARRNPLSDHRPVDLVQVVQSSLLLVGNLVRKSTDRFETESAPELPKVRGDAQQLEQVLVNLLTNACQALPARDRLLAMRTRVAGPGFVEVEVEDEGTGIPPENLSKILDPFFTTKREEGGTGLGLSVSWAIVQAHRGEMVFHPRAGGGTRVVVRLPVAMVEEPT